MAFLSLGVVSYARYPAAFSLTKNWLSDLGDQSLNPHGASFFRFDVILMGLIIALFFTGLVVLRDGQRGRTRVFITLSQLFGLVSAVALAMTGVFAEGLHSSHALWACLFFVFSGGSVLFSGLAFHHHRSPFKKLICLAFLLCVSEWVFAALSRVHVLEWVVIALLIVYFASVAVGTSAVASGRTSTA